MNISLLGKFIINKLGLLNYIDEQNDLEVKADPKFSGKGLTSVFLFNIIGSL